MKHIKFFLVLFFSVLAGSLQAQYTHGTGRGDAMTGNEQAFTSVDENFLPELIVRYENDLQIIRIEGLKSIDSRISSRVVTTLGKMAFAFDFEPEEVVFLSVELDKGIYILELRFEKKVLAKRFYVE